MLSTESKTATGKRPNFRGSKGKINLDKCQISHNLLTVQHSLVQENVQSATATTTTTATITTITTYNYNNHYNNTTTTITNKTNERETYSSLQSDIAGESECWSESAIIVYHKHIHVTNKVDGCT